MDICSACKGTGIVLVSNPNQLCIKCDGTG